MSDEMNPSKFCSFSKNPKIPVTLNGLIEICWCHHRNVAGWAYNCCPQIIRWRSWEICWIWTCIFCWKKRCQNGLFVFFRSCAKHETCFFLNFYHGSRLRHRIFLFIVVLPQLRVYHFLHYLRCRFFAYLPSVFPWP